MPWPVPGDGECLIHTILFCRGCPNDHKARIRLRRELAAFVEKNIDDPELQQALVCLGEKGLSEEGRSVPCPVPPPTHRLETEPPKKQPKIDSTHDAMPIGDAAEDIDEVVEAITKITNITQKKTSNAILLRSVARQLTPPQCAAILENQKEALQSSAHEHTQEKDTDDHAQAGRKC